jgi:hypothetical protein
VTAPEPGATGGLKALQDTAVAAIRTAFPALWAALLVWAVTKVPVLDDFKLWLDGPAQAVILGVLVYGVRYLFGFIEKKRWIPDWLVVILMGSAKRPLYVVPPVADIVNGGASVTIVAEKKAA